MKRFTASLLAFFILLSLCACGNGSRQDKSGADDSVLSFTDDLGRAVDVKSADRVAALIGSFADIWCVAGGKDSLVAAANDAWTSFDLNLDDAVVNIGPVKTPDLEKIISSAPDLVLCSCNTKADVELEDEFEKAGITAAYFDVENFDDYMRMLKICTDLTGNSENYTIYGENNREIIEKARAKADGTSPSVLYVRASGNSCSVKGSEGNLLGEMLKDLGCINVADTEGALLENLSMESIMAADPDFIFAVLQSADPEDAGKMLDATLLSNPAWQSLTAVREGRFIILENSLYNLKPNAKWGEAYEKLADIIYG